MFDETGRIEGPAEDLVAFRLGDGLRESELVQPGPRFDALRVPNLAMTFFDGEQP